MPKPSLVGTVTDRSFSLLSSAIRAIAEWTSHEKSVAPLASRTGKLLPPAGILVLTYVVLLLHSQAWSQQPRLHNEHAGYRVCHWLG